MPLSQKQMEYLALAWSCFESEPKIDYEKFRQVANLASAHSARELMRVTKKKLHEEYGTISNSQRTAASKSATPTARVSKPAARKPTTSDNKSKKIKTENGAGNGGRTAASTQQDHDMDDCSGDDEPATPAAKRKRTAGVSPFIKKEEEPESLSEEDQPYF